MAFLITGPKAKLNSWELNWLSRQCRVDLKASMPQHACTETHVVYAYTSTVCIGGWQCCDANSPRTAGPHPLRVLIGLPIT